MKTLEFLTEIDTTKSLVRLQEINAQIIRIWGEGGIADDKAEVMLQSVHCRKQKLRDGAIGKMPSGTFSAKMPDRLSYFPPKRKKTYQRDREASLARRRVNAASGPMPPRLAAKFTTGELSVLNIIADEVRSNGSCQKTLGEISARAGVCITTARNAIRFATEHGLVTVQERRRYRQPNLANVIRIISAEWLDWLDYRNRKAQRSIGCKKLESTDKQYYLKPKERQSVSVESNKFVKSRNHQPKRAWSNREQR